MDQLIQMAKQKSETPLAELVDKFLLGSKTSEEWKLIYEQANQVLHSHTQELRELMAEMRNYSHQTSVETVIAAQSRMAALRWLIQSIEREIQRLDKAYRETAQMEQLLQDRVRFNSD
ncbi:MAG: hypothetical protein DHS20C20_09050 [Ardenticatenaceae bacterium]|nr:MAG: hypothetical protein DHS20C20_09050 [Ardenticatenaceae bacterium]